MLSSVPTTTKSRNWLHRLRSSRGFPASDHIDLEHFLSTSSHKTDPTDPSPNRKPPPLDDNSLTENCYDDNEPLQGRDLINNVLSDLFYMGEVDDQSRIKKKKSCRKQPCPRNCVVTTKDRVSSRSTLPLTSIGRRKVKEVNQVKEVKDVSAAYSQTEVTVIDTSVPCWKFEKVLYRSKNVWKVGEKKGKGLMMSGGDRKKRKDGLNETAGDVPKKKKKLKKKLKLCSSSKFDQGHDHGKMVGGNEKKRDNCNQEKSYCKKQLDEGSSVILIKSIPITSKKNVPGVSNSVVKSMQR